MSARIKAAANSFLSCANVPFAGLPISIGIHVAQTAAGVAGALFALIGGAHYIRLLIGATQWTFTDSVTNLTNFGDTTILGRPYFVLMRCITTTNTWIDILNPDGSITSQQIVGAVNGTVDTLKIGTNQDVVSIDGDVSGLFYTPFDICRDGAACPPSLLRRLDAHGPLSVPTIAAAIRTKGEFRSLRSRITTIDPAEVLWGAHAAPTWINNNGVTLGPENPYAAAWVHPHEDDGLIPVVIPPEVAAPAVAARRRRGGFLVSPGRFLGR